jgi:hypothetical protein
MRSRYRKISRGGWPTSLPRFGTPLRTGSQPDERSGFVPSASVACSKRTHPRASLLLPKGHENDGHNEIGHDVSRDSQRHDPNRKALGHSNEDVKKFHHARGHKSPTAPPAVQFITGAVAVLCTGFGTAFAQLSPGAVLALAAGTNHGLGLIAWATAGDRAPGAGRIARVRSRRARGRATTASRYSRRPRGRSKRR